MDQPLAQARFNMIHQQVRPWGVLDERVLDALEQVPRERFVPTAYLSLAYADIEIPIGGAGEHMLSPKLVGRVLQAVAVKPGDRTLEIGTGTGYVTACLARLGARALSLEIDPGLAAEARTRLSVLGFGQVEVRVADGLAGRVEGGPFDVIVLTGSLPSEESLPALDQQLTIGGRLFAVVGMAPAMTALLLTRVGELEYRRESLFETCIDPLANAVEPARFVF
jgi:protein-L-isoaspartate(D-aspartate) O-methyltransferase